MVVFSFFVISNTGNALDFHIEATAMDCPLRFSAIKSLHHRKYDAQEPIKVVARSNRGVLVATEHLRVEIAELPGKTTKIADGSRR